MASSTASTSPRENSSHTAMISSAAAAASTDGAPLVLPCAVAGATQRARAAMQATAARIALTLYRLDDLLGGIVQVVGGNHIEAGLVQDGLAFLDIGAFETN